MCNHVTFHFHFVLTCTFILSPVPPHPAPLYHSIQFIVVVLPSDFCFRVPKFLHRAAFPFTIDLLCMNVSIPIEASRSFLLQFSPDVEFICIFTFHLHDSWNKMLPGMVESACMRYMVFRDKVSSITNSFPFQHSELPTKQFVQNVLSTIRFGHKHCWTFQHPWVLRISFAKHSFKCKIQMWKVEDVILSSKSFRLRFTFYVFTFLRFTFYILPFTFYVYVLGLRFILSFYYIIIL